MLALLWQQPERVKDQCFQNWESQYTGMDPCDYPSQVAQVVKSGRTFGVVFDPLDRLSYATLQMISSISIF